MSRLSKEQLEELRMKILFYRKKKGFSQEEVAERMNIARNRYAYLETTAVKYPQEKLIKLAKALEVSPAVFLNTIAPAALTVENTPSSSVKPESFPTSAKEQRIIKMLRMLSNDAYDEIYNIIRREYEQTMLDDN